MALREGQQLGNYRLLRLLGRGGAAAVYLGQHIHLDTLAAIKVLRTHLVDEDVGHFRTEARTIARLVHPHIVRVLDFGIEAMTPFLVMEYAPNGTLRERHPNEIPLALSTVVNYVSQLAQALQYAHEQGVIHRDVKPENMLLGRAGELLLSDFGIALAASSQQQSTQRAQEMAGTIAYMAPEQIHAQVTVSSDQYALGIVVYEWLSGTRPFEGSWAEVALKHALEAPPRLREKLPTLSASVEEVVMRALAKEPQQRFASVLEFAKALEQVCQRELGAPEARSTAPELHTPSSAPTETMGASNWQTAPTPPPMVPLFSPEALMPISPSNEASLYITNQLFQGWIDGIRKHNQTVDAPPE
ncbi:MAG: serine/threonine protein kinase [Ktedonobacteraceae bacterium]|nr:serine/threonine protein kinase [Ktedonobacteraceae bacterium]